MTVRITPYEEQEVQRLRALGRTDRQIERILGLTHGLLSRAYVIGEDARPVMDRDPHGGGWRYPDKAGDPS